jgi:hypothetical protein
MDAISQALRSGRTEVIDADLSGYFDSIPHAESLRLAACRVSDGAILALIKAWLRAPDCGTEPEHGPTPHHGEQMWQHAKRRDFTPAGQPVSESVDWQVNERCKLRPVLVRYADDFVILSRPGQGSELKPRLQLWLDRHGLKLNEEKTRLLDVRQAGFKFLSFGIGWRRGKSGRGYPHIEPHPKSQAKLRDKIQAKLSQWTLWRAADKMIPGLNRLLKGWGGVFPLREQHADVRPDVAVCGEPGATLAVAQRRVCAETVGDDATESTPRTLGSVSAAFVGGVETGFGVEAMRANGPRTAGCGKTACPVRWSSCKLCAAPLLGLPLSPCLPIPWKSPYLCMTRPKQIQAYTSPPSLVRRVPLGSRAALTR